MELVRCINEAAVYCGYETLKPEQRQVILEFLNGRDVFVCLPTGFGKSACYLCLPRVYDLYNEKPSGHSMVIVVSPLVSLMKDQVRSCKERGINAAAICSDERELEKEAAKGAYQLIYISPEMLLGTNKWRAILTSDLFQSRLVGVVVDEAHCVKSW